MSENQISKKTTQTKKATTKASKKTSKKTSTLNVSKKEIKIPKGVYNLVIVESPSKAKTIKKYLGKGFQVVASNGHIKDLPKSKLGVDLKNNFELDIVYLSGKKDKIERICALAKHADKVYLAPDMDREGEAIAFHLAEEIGRKKDVYRVVFNAVTKTAVVNAINNPTVLQKDLYDAQRTRRVLDRLVGYKISPILWDKIQYGISAGRVQSVALRLIFERELEIKAFVPVQWFSIEGQASKSQIDFEVKYYGESADKKKELLEEDFVNKIMSDISSGELKVENIVKKERRQNPTPPFTTSKLQQESANKLGFTAKRTMMAAQKLYEGIDLTDFGMQGLITYMRTDSVRTEPEAIEEARNFIKDTFGQKYLPSIPNVFTKKGKSKVQDAHEAIRPTSLKFSPDVIKGDLEPDHFKLYCLIWNKFVSSQMSQAIIDQTSITFSNNNHFFKANGSIIKFAGYRKIYLNSLSSSKKSSETILPELTEGEKLSFSEGPNKEEHFTSPPPRYSEATIVKDLEEKGIGRPSTYAAIISNLQDRRYVEKIENRFFPTDLGMIVCKMLIESFADIMNIEFTSQIEELLDKIEDGKAKWKNVLRDFWKGFEATLETAKAEMKDLKKQMIPTGIHCPKCKDGEYNIKWGRNGQFLACSNYPECNATDDFTRDYDGNYHIVPKKWFREKCPTCSKRMQEKKGKYGRFVRCEDYPNCDTTLPYTIDVTCPKCKKGKFAEKKSRFGKFFYGCSNYPDCENALWSKPYDYACKSCGYGLMLYRETKREGKQLQCPECKYKVDLSETPFAEKNQ